MADEQPLLVALGAAIRQARTAQRLSQEGLGNATNIHRNYLGGVERGERQPTITTVARIAEVLEVPVSELLARAEAMLNDPPAPPTRKR